MTDIQSFFADRLKQIRNLLITGGALPRRPVSIAEAWRNRQRHTSKDYEITLVGLASESRRTRSGNLSFVLEDEKHARDRGAKILGTVLGAGSSCVAALDGTPNRRQAVVNAIAAALSDAGITAGQVGHVNAHGQGTRKCDVEEALAIRDVFGDATDSLPVTALKSALGNSGAGSGSLELAASLLALQSGVVPRTLNYSQPDPECRLDVVHAELRPVENRTLLKISVNAHGQASALIIAAA